MTLYHDLTVISRNVRHTDIAEYDRKEYEPVQGTPEQHQHVHAEVVDVEELGLGKEEDKDSKKLGDSDPTEHGGSHVVQSGLGPLPTTTSVRHKPTNNVRAELNRYTNGLQRRRRKVKRCIYMK